MNVVMEAEVVVTPVQIVKVKIVLAMRIGLVMDYVMMVAGACTLIVKNLIVMVVIVQLINVMVIMAAAAAVMVHVLLRLW